MASLKSSNKSATIPDITVNPANTQDEFKTGIEISSADKRSTPDLNTNKIEELFNLTVKEPHNKPTALLNPNLISRRLTRSPSVRSSSQTSIISKLSKHGKGAKERKLPLKRSSSKASSRSMKSTSSMNEIFEENVTVINENEETNLSLVESKEDESIEENIEVDFETLCPQNKCGDLMNMKFANNQEKYLVIRIYSKVSNLSMILSQMNQINLQYYLNTPDENECLPIYYAIKSDCMSTLRLLVEKGATLRRTTAIGDPAPHLACLLGVSIELLDFLLSFDKDDSNLYFCDQEGWTILHCACNQGHLEIVKYLIEEKHMNPNIKDFKNRYTGLQLATMNDRIEVVQYFLTFTTLARVASLSTFEKEKEEPTSGSNLSNAASINTSSYNNFTAVKNLSELNSVNTHMRSKTNLSKALTSSNSSIISASTNKNSIYNPDSIANVNYRKFKKRFNFKSQLSVVGSEKSNEQENKSTTSIAKEPLVKKTREKISINSNMTYFEADNKFKKEPISVFKNFIIDLNSQSSDGQNVLHTAARFGKYDIAYLLLKKYGSSHLDLNKLDFRGRTCMDLAWEWILNSTNIESNTENSQIKSTDENGKVNIFYDKDASLYIQKNMLLVNKGLEKELRMVHLLSKYGAKFSHYKLLLYDFELLNQYEDSDIDLPSNLFHPFDHISFVNLKLQNSNIVPIMTYLKCLVSILKLNLPTMFLYQKDVAPLMKQDLAYNLHDLVIFIQKNVIEPIEKKLYFENIQEIFEYLTKF